MKHQYTCSDWNRMMILQKINSEQQSVDNSKIIFSNLLNNNWFWGAGLQLFVLTTPPAIIRGQILIDYWLFWTWGGTLFVKGTDL